MTNSVRIVLFLVACVSCIVPICLWAGETAEARDYKLKVEVLTEGLNHPWSMAFLPDGRMLITERPGRLRLLSDDYHLVPASVENLPDIEAKGQGGLLDVVLHPDYKNNAWLYLSYVAEGRNGLGVEVVRAKLVDHRLEKVDPIFRARPKSSGGRHFGSRLVFDQQQYLYITLGERGDKERAQRLDDHAGSVVRLHDDGRIPVDNPFPEQKQVAKGLFSYGHRNPQGMAFDPVTNQLWVHEHGPQGGDELNLLTGGKNYGWPVITYGVNYVFGTKIGEGHAKAGMMQPIHYWVPTSIAPSGMAIYRGSVFKKWRGDIFLGALRGQMLVRLKIKENKVVTEEHLLKNQLGRIRDVRVGPDGLLYLLIDARNGKLVRLSPLTE